MNSVWLRRLTLPRLLVGCCVMVVLSILWQGARPFMPTIKIKQSQALLSTAPAIAPVMFPPEEHFNEVTARPLFLATRRPIPIVQTTTQQASQTAALDRYTIVGIVASPAKSSAVLKGDGGGAPVRLNIGQTLEGWTLVNITSRKLTFTADGQQRILEILIRGKSSSLPQPGELKTGTP